MQGTWYSIDIGHLYIKPLLPARHEDFLLADWTFCVVMSGLPQAWKWYSTHYKIRQIHCTGGSVCKGDFSRFYVYTAEQLVLWSQCLKLTFGCHSCSEQTGAKRPCSLGPQKARRKEYLFSLMCKLGSLLNKTCHMFLNLRFYSFFSFIDKD